MNDVRILARFATADGVVPYERMKARLWDQDPLRDDLLGEAAPDHAGLVAFQFNLDSVASVDSPGEVKPDLYIQVLLDDVEVFRTPVIEDVVFGTNSLSDFSSPTATDLGTFQLPDLRGLDPLSRRDFMRAFVEPPNA